MSRLVNLVEDSVITHADPEEPFVADHRLCAVGTRILLETAEVRLEPLSDGKRKPKELALSRGDEFEPVSHAVTGRRAS